MTLHWFVHPLWFEEMGGFAKYENIDVYVEWAKKAFELFGESHLGKHLHSIAWVFRVFHSSGWAGVVCCSDIIPDKQRQNSELRRRNEWVFEQATEA